MMEYLSFPLNKIGLKDHLQKNATLIQIFPVAHLSATPTLPVG